MEQHIFSRECSSQQKSGWVSNAGTGGLLASRDPVTGYGAVDCRELVLLKPDIGVISHVFPKAALAVSSAMPRACQSPSCLASVLGVHSGGMTPQTCHGTWH